MAIDLTGGLPDDREYVFATQPDNPEMRESVNTWVWDNGTEFGMPRIGVEAVADQWDTHDIQVNIAFADGRVLNMFGPGKVHDPARRRRQAAHPRRRSARVRAGRAVRATGRVASTVGDGRRRSRPRSTAGMPGAGDGEQVPVQLELDIRSAVPPWESGTLLEEARRVLATQEEGALMGGPALRAAVPRDRHAARRRRRVLAQRRRPAHPRARASGGWPRSAGTCGSRRVFPSGRALRPVPLSAAHDGKPTFNEGFLFEGDGELIPAWVIDAPWLRRPASPRARTPPSTLETEQGKSTTIQGATVLSTFMVMGAGAGASTMPRSRRWAPSACSSASSSTRGATRAPPGCWSARRPATRSSERVSE